MSELELGIAHLEKQKNTHRKNIRILDPKIAKYTELEAPLHLLTQREDEREQLRQVQNQLEVLEAALEVLKDLGLEGEQEPLRQLKEQLEVLKSVKRPVSICLIQVIIALVAVLVIGGAALFLVIRRGEPVPHLLAVVRTGSEIHIDGLLDESAWSEGDSLTYAVHPAKNGSTTATAHFLWDDDYLYVGFDVNDTEVETADLSTIWDSDSVSLLLHDGGIAEHRQSLGENLGDYRAIQLKPMTTLNEPADADNGYTVEMRIKWRQPPLPGRRIPADLLSVDHDANPGAEAGAPGTVFSKLTWDGDGDITSAGASLLLVDGEHSGGEGFVCRISEFGTLLQQKLALGEGSFYTAPLD